MDYPNANVSGYLPGTFSNAAWLIKAYVTDGTYTYNLYRNGEAIETGLTSTSYTDTNRNNTASFYTIKTNYYGGETAASNGVGYTLGEGSLSTLELTGSDAMTITEGSKLTVSGTLSNSVADNLILENGAQLVNSSNGVQATVKKAINPYTQNGGWYLIASPMVEDLTATDVTDLLANRYDLYTFDQSKTLEWYNYKAHNFSIDNKTGYLYANSGNPTLTFAGTLANTATATDLIYDGNARFKGFNLIGNPFPCEAYVNRSFYVLNQNGSDFIEGSGAIAPCSAILVQAQDENDNSITFSKTAFASKPSITARLKTVYTKEEAVIDQARVCFEETDQLTKFTMGNCNALLYIPQGTHDYAVACANGQTEMPLNFKTTKNGTYTLDFEVENMETNYLHLIDNMTGAHVDLLTTPSYTFEATTDDYEARFRLVLASTCEDADGDNEHFAYYANGEIRLIEPCQGASIQVVDMTGRVITSCVGRIQCVPTSGMTTGVYIIRLINGEQVKTQKIVVQ
jgi:hypothetical protein